MNEFKNAWKGLASRKTISRYDMAVLVLSRVLRQEKLSKQDKPINVMQQTCYYLKKCFKPISKQIKLDNGAIAYHAMWDAVRNYERSSLIQREDKLFNDETLSQLKVLSSNIASGSYGKVNLHEQ